MMVEEKKTENKKIEELKETPENKAAVAKSEGRVVEDKEIIKQDEQDSRKKEESKPAVAKTPKVKKEKKVDAKVDIEREYVVPMRKGFMNVPHYRRAKKAVKTLKEFMVRHMNVRDNDTRKIKVDIALNNEIWFRGIKKPLHKIKVKAVKKDGIVKVTLADPSDYVKFKLAREEKRKKLTAAPEKAKAAPKKKEEKDADKDGVDDKKEDAEDKKAGTEKAVKEAKVEAKVEKHTAQGKHVQKTAPVRKVLK
jgi:ribosomal protein L31E